MGKKTAAAPVAQSAKVDRLPQRIYIGPDRPFGLPLMRNAILRGEPQAVLPQLTAAFALGACGVQVGTCLLASEECPIHVNYKQAVLKAGANDTTVTGRSTGAPVRVLKNKMAREYLRMEKKDVPLEEMEQLTLGSLRKAVFDGDVDGGSFMAGQVAGMVHEIRPLRQIFEELMAGYAAVRKGLSE